MIGERKKIKGAERPSQGFRAQVYGVVARIPRGRVLTYGAVAGLVGRPRAARQVGQALARAPEHLNLPCHRVIRADGSLASKEGFSEVQRLMLEDEGVCFDASGRVVFPAGPEKSRVNQRFP